MSTLLETPVLPGLTLVEEGTQTTLAETRTLQAITEGVMGPQGIQGPPGSLDGTTALPQDVNGPLIFKVGQAFGQDVRRYGSLGTDAAINTATINAALTNHAQWQELIIPVPAGADLPINAPLVLGECIGKRIRTLGVRNPLTVSGGRILQMGNAMPIFHWNNVNFGRAMEFEMGLAYNTQQSDPASVGFQITPITNGVPHDVRANLSVEKAYDGFKCVMTGAGGGPWNFDITARIWNSWHTGLEFVAVGSVPSKFNLFISNTGSGLVPTGPALKLWNSQSVISWLDVEGWADMVGDLLGGSCTIDKLHIEHHIFNASSYPRIFKVLTCHLRLHGGSVVMEQTTPGTIATGYATVVYIEGGATKLGKLYADDIDINFPTALTGNVVFLDGGSGIEECFVGHGVKNYGTKLIDIPVTPVGGYGLTYSGYNPPTKYRYPFPTPWVVPTLAAGWTTVVNYQPPRYRKWGDVIEIEGVVQNTSGGSLPGATPVFTLPVGFRPALNQTDVGWTSIGTTPVVLTTGTVSSPSAIANNGFLPIKTRFSVLA